MDHFVAVLGSLTEPACAVKGRQTSYVYLLDAALSHVLAGVAIDPPIGAAVVTRPADPEGGP
jgi:hypothetical protein